NLVRLLLVRRWLAKLACRDFHVLFLERADYITRRKTARSQTHRIDPYAHRVFPLAEDDYVAHARHALESVFHVNVKVIRDELARVAIVAREETYAENKVANGLVN